jgi:hypothetical protein
MGTMRLKELYDVSDFLPKGGALSLSDYASIKSAFLNDGSSGCYKAFIINFVPIKSVPSQHQEQAGVLHNLLKSRALLNSMNDIEALDPISGGTIRKQFTLYDLITKHNKFPAHKYIPAEQINILNEIDNFHKTWALERFFINQGSVFWGDAIESVSKTSYFTPYNPHSLKVYYPMLLRENILREATETDVSVLLGFKTKKQLQDIILKLDCFDSKTVKSLRTKGKQEIIAALKDKKEIKEVELQNYFYFLSDPYQQYKEWLVLQEVYYRVFELFDHELDFFWLSLDTLMKDLIQIHSDFETANKLGKLFYAHLKDFERNRVYKAEWEIPRIKAQMKKIKVG